MDTITQALPHITLAALGLPAVLVGAGGLVAAFMWSELRDGRRALAARRAKAEQAREHARALRRIRAVATLETYERSWAEALGRKRTPKALPPAR